MTMYSGREVKNIAFSAMGIGCVVGLYAGPVVLGTASLRNVVVAILGFAVFTWTIITTVRRARRRNDSAQQETDQNPAH